MVGAAAVLAGLVFLAVSINIGRIMAIPGLPGRAGESVIFFLGVLVESALLLIPGQSATALGIELLVSAGMPGCSSSRSSGTNGIARSTANPPPRHAADQGR